MVQGKDRNNIYYLISTLGYTLRFEIIVRNQIYVNIMNIKFKISYKNRIYSCHYYHLQRSLAFNTQICSKIYHRNSKTQSTSKIWYYTHENNKSTF